ncbi:MAG: efflux RND transporter permease subunit [Deltaproteobacteria bacterium]|nr:efflux RND transporter permease subunit [Deltaproteobacteria bacterium]
MSLAGISVRRPVTLLMAYGAVTAFGVIALDRIPIDMFPPIEPPVISVATIYPGAGPLEVEEKVTKPIEDNLGILPNLEKLTSNTKEGLSVVTCQFTYGTKIYEAAAEIRDRLEFAKRLLPSDIRPPIVFRFNSAIMPVLGFAVVSKRGRILDDREYVKRAVGEEIQRVAGVGAVQMFNLAPRQIVVEARATDLARTHVPILRLVRALAAENVSLPAGRLDLGELDYPIRVPGEFQSIAEIESVIVGRATLQENALAPAAGAIVRVRDVASVRPDFEEVRQIARSNKDDALFFMVQKQSGANTVEVVRRIRTRALELGKTLPEHLKLVQLFDSSEFIVQMLASLAEAVWAGGLFVILVVFVFLWRVRASIIIALTIPTSMIVAFFLIYAFGYTINSVSLMSLALAIGMVVDNAIVVLENIERHRAMGKSPSDAAADGAREMGLAIGASTLTTIAIFAPLIFVTGFIGIIFGQLAFVMTVTLVASWIVAVTLTPMLAARWATRSRYPRWERITTKLDTPYRLLERGYGHAVGWAVTHKLVVLVAAVGMLVGTVTLITRTGVDFMPPQDSGEVEIIAELPTGRGLRRTAEVAEKLSAILAAEPETKSTFYMAGTSEGGFQTSVGGREGSNVARVYARLSRPSERTRRDVEVVDSIRPKIAQIPDIVAVDYKTGSPLTRIFSGQEKAVTIDIRGTKFGEVEKVAQRLRDIVAAVPGTVDVSIDLGGKRPELQIIPDRGLAEREGVSMETVAFSARAALFGATVSKYRGNGDDVDLVVRLRPEDRETADHLIAIEVPSSFQTLVPLSRIARVVERETPIEIVRKEKQRTVRVGANVRGRALSDVTRDIEQARAAESFPKDIIIRYGGDVEQQKTMQREMGLVLILGILLVYMVMAAQFESLLDPFVILFSIPFAFTGVFLFLFLTNTTLTFSALLGLIMLMGIVVNNAIVFVSMIGDMRRTLGRPMLETIVETGKSRLRPILMTTITTVIGMIPLAITTGEGAELWRPIGIAMVGGLSLSTFVTLLIVPVIYALTERFRRVGRSTVRETTPIPDTPNPVPGADV